jgi:hypothetical protein
MSNHKPKTDSRVLTVGLLISVLICAFYIYAFYLLIMSSPRLPPGAVYKTNDVIELTGPSSEVLWLQSPYTRMTNGDEVIASGYVMGLRQDGVVVWKLREVK